MTTPVLEIVRPSRRGAPSTVRLVGDGLGEALDARTAEAVDAHRADVRADGALTGALDTARCLHRVFAAQHGASAGNRLARAMGYVRADRGELRHRMVRSDSYYLPGDLTAEGLSGLEQNQTRRDLQTIYPAFDLDAWADEYKDSYVEDFGAAVAFKGKSTDIPEVEIGARQKRHPMVWIVTRVNIDWSERGSLSRSTIDVPARKTAGAYLAIEKAYENLLRSGYEGLEVSSLADIPCLEATVDLTGATLADQRNAIAAGLKTLYDQIADEDQEEMDMAVIDRRIMNLFRGQAVIGDSGILPGTVALQGALASFSVERFLPARVGPSRKGENYRTIVLSVTRTGDALMARGQLMRPVAVAPAPLSTAEHHGTSVIVGTKVGGLVSPRAGDVMKLHCKIA